MANATFLYILFWRHAPPGRRWDYLQRTFSESDLAYLAARLGLGLIVSLSVLIGTIWLPTIGRTGA